MMRIRTFNGVTAEQMKKVLYYMCDIEDEIDQTPEEQDMFDTAIQCVASIMNMITYKDWDPIIEDD